MENNIGSKYVFGAPTLETRATVNHTARFESSYVSSRLNSLNILDILRTCSPEELAKFKPLTDADIREALDQGKREADAMRPMLRMSRMPSGRYALPIAYSIAGR